MGPGGSSVYDFHKPRYLLGTDPLDRRSGRLNATVITTTNDTLSPPYVVMIASLLCASWPFISLRHYPSSNFRSRNQSNHFSAFTNRNSFRIIGLPYLTGCSLLVPAVTGWASWYIINGGWYLNCRFVVRSRVCVIFEGETQCFFVICLRYVLHIELLVRLVPPPSSFYTLSFPSSSQPRRRTTLHSFLRAKLSTIRS